MYRDESHIVVIVHRELEMTEGAGGVRTMYKYSLKIVGVFRSLGVSRDDVSFHVSCVGVGYGSRCRHPFAKMAMRCFKWCVD